jgi:hypothetical protein
VGLLALALVLACRTAPPPTYAGTSIVITARVSSLRARIGRVTASADAMGPIALHPSGVDEFHGVIALGAGPHIVSIEAFDDAGIRRGATTVSVTSARDSPALLDATVRPVATIGTATRRQVSIDALISPRSSVVQGERLLLEGRTVGESTELQLSWSADPPGCGTFSPPSGLSTEWSAMVPGPCTVTLTAATAQPRESRAITVIVRSHGRFYEYPLMVAPNGRLVVDQHGAPFLIKGETAWLALANLTETEQEQYLSDRSAKGFNVVEVMLINHNYTASPNPVPPANRAGEQPFFKPGDFSTPNDAYFDRALAFVRRAASHGVVVLLAPSYLGFDGGAEGWWRELNSPVNTRAVCGEFGRYLGAKFKASKNLIWLAGGDFAPPSGSEGEARQWEILDGIRAAGASQLWTGHWNLGHRGGISTDEPRFREAMALNGVYQYSKTYRYTGRAYQTWPRRPVFLLESTYEHEHSVGEDQPFRKAWWWTMLSGGTGVLWSNTFLWMSEAARGQYRLSYGDVDGAVSSWTAELDSAGTFEALHLHAFFEGLPWHRLLPIAIASDITGLVTSWLWWGQKRIASAATREGDVFVVYVPPSGDGSRSFTVDLSALRGPGRARWYDPSAGTWITVAGTLPASRGVRLDTPGANASGANDWALVVEASPRSD